MSEIDDLYKEILGRDRDENERASEEENVSKYGIDQLRKNLEERSNNKPGQDEDRGSDDHQERKETSSSNSGASATGQAVINSWSQVPDTFTNAITQQNDILRKMQEAESTRAAQVAAEKAASDAKRDELYGELQTRARQGTDVSAADSDIKMLVDPYRAEQVRERRNLISDIAEEEGPLGNIRGEERMAAERTGINTSNYQAQAMQQKLQAKRAEIADALTSMRGMLTADQQANLQRELDTYDNQIQQIQTGITSASTAGNLGLGYSDLSLRDQLGNRGLGIQESLGNRGLDLQALADEMRNRQFYDDLGLRTGIAQDNSNRWQSGF